MKLQCVRQHSEEDCGAASLATLSKFYGRNITLNRVREAVGTGQLGTTLLGLRRGAESLGFNARSVKANAQVLDRLHEAPLPAIIHWRGNHWVVLYGKRQRKYAIADPAVGIRYLSKQELAEGWADGVTLLLEPDAVRFYIQPDQPVSGLGRFLRRALPYRALLMEVLVINVVLGLLALAFPFLLQVLTDDVLIRGDSQLLTKLAIAILILQGFSNLLQWVQSNLIAQFAQRLELGFVLEFGRQLLRLPLSYYEARRSGEITTRLRDIQEINQLISQVVIRLPNQFFVAMISISLMIVYSWKLSVAAAGIAVGMFLSSIILLPTLQQQVRRVLVLESENQGILVETFRGALTLKTTAASPQLWEELQIRFGKLANLVFSTVQISIVNNIFSGFVSSAGSIALLWLGSSLVINRELSIRAIASV
jgi:ATP-binding cassette, subfamily C, bacterial